MESSPVSFNSLRHFPVVHCSRFRREADADAVELARVVEVGMGIAFLPDLAEGFVGGSVEFEFKDVDVSVRLDDAVDAAFALLLFGVDRIDAYEAQEQVKGFR